MPKDASPSKINDDFLSANSKDANSVFAVIRADKHIDPENKGSSRSEKLLLSIFESDQTTFKEAVQGLGMIKEYKGNVNNYKAEARKRFPMANIFQESVPQAATN